MAQIALADISPDRALWPRVRLSARHVQRLVATPEMWPPVLLRLVEQGRYRYQLVDGFHRVEAARRLGMLWIEARVEAMDDGLALARAAHENSHGMRLSDDAITAGVLALLDGGKSAAWIAEQTGLSPCLIRQVRRGRLGATHG